MLLLGLTKNSTSLRASIAGLSSFMRTNAVSASKSHRGLCTVYYRLAMPLVRHWTRPMSLYFLTITSGIAVKEQQPIIRYENPQGRVADVGRLIND